MRKTIFSIVLILGPVFYEVAILGRVLWVNILAAPHPLPDTSFLSAIVSVSSHPPNSLPSSEDYFSVSAAFRTLLVYYFYLNPS